MGKPWSDYEINILNTEYIDPFISKESILIKLENRKWQSIIEKASKLNLSRRHLIAEELFWTKINFTDSCWLWTAGLDSSGYGHFHLNGRCLKAHRYIYSLLIKEIGDNLEVDHLCRIRNCVNPDHLELVTKRENIIRGIGPTAQNARKTHCKYGHEFTPENTYIFKTCRHCKKCALKRAKEQKLKCLK